jgi:NADPH-dependent 2,4-dienoyl-CoA reductase/sulfur reductase-like enzyme/rhodanese-related sulfurtransferase
MGNAHIIRRCFKRRIFVIQRNEVYDMKVIIVGGVAGGATAAARLRRLDEKAEIIIYERSGYISYANCGLPYYIGGVIEDGEDLTLQTPEGFARRFRISAKVLHEVIDIHAETKTVLVKNLKTGEVFEDVYDKLILSPGAKPSIPTYAPTNAENVFTLRTVEDTFRIHEYIEQNDPKSVTIIGGGFIGLEMAENLRSLGLNVTILQRGDQLLSILDRDMASFLHAKCKANGIRLVFGAKITAITSENGRVLVTAEHMSTFASDMLILSIGVTPENTLGERAGLMLGQKGAIVVNDKMETSKPDIYAVGDAVEVSHLVTGKPAVISLAGPANKQGRIAADNICGLDSHYRGSQGSSIMKMFDMTVAMTGINEKTAKKLGIEYEKIILSPASHAGYYPGASVMTMKVIYEQKTEKLLGAQIVGYDGVDKRIDVLATAIFAGLPASELKNLDLAYAPPYSSAKDPVNMAGFIIDNVENGIVKHFHYEDIDTLRHDPNAILLDTRTPMEYMRGHAEGFLHIPLDDLRDRLHELDRTKKVYVMCQSGLRSYLATRILMQNGFDAYNFSGGFRFYQSVHMDIEAAKRALPCGAEC